MQDESRLSRVDLDDAAPADVELDDTELADTEVIDTELADSGTIDGELIDAELEGDVDVAADVAVEDLVDEPGAVEASVWERIDWIACGVLMVASIVLVGLHVRVYSTLSPIDELQHIDYVLKASEGEIPRSGDRVGFEAMAEAACRSVDSPGYVSPECGLESYDPNAFQERGFNTSASQFPVYYAITGVAARVMTAVGIFDSPVTAARMFGAVWAGAAWGVLWYVMAMFRIPRRQRAVAVALLMVTPITLFHAATVNTDTSLLLCGSVGLLAVLKFEEGKLAPWWLALVFVGLLFVEPTNLLIAGAGGAYLLVRVTASSAESMLRRATPAVMLVALAVLRLEFTNRIRDALFPRTATPGSEPLSSAPMFVNHRLTDGVSLERVLQQLNAVFTPVINPYLSPPLRSQFTIAFIQLTNWLLIALMFAVAFAIAGSMRLAWLSRLGMAAMLAAGPFYTFYYAHWSNQDFPAPARFGLPLVSIIVVTVASALSRRSAFVITAVITSGVAVNTVVQLVTA